MVLRRPALHSYTICASQAVCGAMVESMLLEVLGEECGLWVIRLLWLIVSNEVVPFLAQVPKSSTQSLVQHPHASLCLKSCLCIADCWTCLMLVHAISSIIPRTSWFIQASTQRILKIHVTVCDSEGPSIAFSDTRKTVLMIEE